MTDASKTLEQDLTLVHTSVCRCSLKEPCKGCLEVRAIIKRDVDAAVAAERADKEMLAAYRTIYRLTEDEERQVRESASSLSARGGRHA